MENNEKISKNKRLSTKISKLFLLFVVPLIILLGIYTWYTAHILNERTKEANVHTLDLYSNEIFQDIEGADIFLNSITSNGKEYQRLQLNLPSIEIQDYERQLLDKYRAILQTNKTVSGLFIFNPGRGCYGAAFRSNVGEITQIELIYYFKDLMKKIQSGSEDRMYIEQIGEQYYLIRLKADKGVSCASVVSFSNIAKNSLVGKEKYVFYGGETGNVFYTDLSREETRILTQNSEKDILVASDGNYRSVRKELGILDINVLYLMKEESHLFLDMTQSLLLCMTALIALLLPFSYRSMRQNIFSPMKSMVQTIERIKQGDMELRMECKQPVEEFTQISESFNGMLDQINKYKIESYENELAVQKARLQYYQVQMRPHFFINCLKNLYALAEEQSYKKIQQMILAFSSYWRHVMQDSLHLIPLRREVESVRDYIELMRMTMELPPCAVIDIPIYIQDYMVPPMLLLTFVENSIKHISTSEKQVQVHIKGMMITNGQQRLNLSITDNGPGFSEESLKRLNSSVCGDEYQGQKIGISNVKQRLDILYHGEAIISFSNNRRGGHIEIFIPIRER